MAEKVTPRGLMSVEEYLEFEKDSPVKHEYVGGHVYAMTEVSRRHSRISLNIARKLADRSPKIRTSKTNLASSSKFSPLAPRRPTDVRSYSPLERSRA